MRLRRSTGGNRPAMALTRFGIMCALPLALLYRIAKRVRPHSQNSKISLASMPLHQRNKHGHTHSAKPKLLKQRSIYFMDNLSLFERLLKAEDETDVNKILEEAGYFTDDPNIWQPFGNYEMNFNLIGNQQADPTAAFVEKVINAGDAVLMAECFKRGLDPESDAAPQSMADAVKEFFNVRDGRLENLSATELTALAEKIQVVAVGAKKSPSYLIVDRGEGQTPASFPDTLLSLNRSNKMRIPFVQGKFNSGGTGILQFCGNQNYELIVSKRHPEASVKPGDTTKDEWGFTLVRRLLPTGGRRASVYVYLAPNNKVLTFTANAVNVLPGQSGPKKPAEAYAVGITYGTIIKLYNYRWKAKSIATTEARFELERFLHMPCLPFRITETRDYSANYYSTTMSGVWVGIGTDAEREEEDRKVEDGFPAFEELNLPKIGKLPYQIGLFRETVKSRNVPHGVFFTVNGQVHVRLPDNFVSTSLKFDSLSPHLLVTVDCTSMNPEVREDFFMASRDRLRRNEVYDELQSQLKEELRHQQGLREYDALRKKKILEKTLSDESTTLNVFQNLLKTDPTLASLLGVGDRLVTTTGPDEKKEFKGVRFPTFFRLSKEPKEGLVKSCPLNKSVRIEFDTEAENNYFKRADSPGSITFDPPNLNSHIGLWNGKYRARFQMPWNAEVDDEVDVTITVTDVQREIRGGPFVSKFRLKGAPEVDDDGVLPGGPRRNGNKPHTQSIQAAPALSAPKSQEVRKES